MTTAALNRITAEARVIRDSPGAEHGTRLRPNIDRFRTLYNLEAGISEAPDDPRRREWWNAWKPVSGR
jgi:hypothetical protein